MFVQIGLTCQVVGCCQCCPPEQLAALDAAVHRWRSSTAVPVACVAAAYPCTTLTCS
jgi:hypothetical protein